ncbi:MAG: peptidoglycan DD-metalloendopeptidase family protein [Betaproteobacteria bacterium]|nr:peptidoglycan DD-metalloendopeptidase family protein [Betaproteobacteria bacterium]
MNEDRGAILAQKAHEPKPKLRWLIALATVPFLGVAVAFGTAPDTQTAPVSIETVIQHLPSPQLQLAPDNAHDGVYWDEARIEDGDTLADVLSRLDVHDPALLRFVDTAPQAQPLFELAPGRTFTAETSAGGRLLALQYLTADNHLLVVRRNGDAFTATSTPATLKPTLVRCAGSIGTSYYGALDAAGVPARIARQMVEIFSTKVDFHQPFQPGDHFALIYQRLDYQGQLVALGHILAAELVHRGKDYRAVYFQDKDGQGGYYTPSGHAWGVAFQRFPLQYTDITSPYGMRFDPVVHRWALHAGVDFGAPIGTPIHATANGTVAFAGQETGYGNIVVIDNEPPYSTAFAHMSRFAKGLHRGTRVHRGEVIGYVGETGWTTGPHLHYEVRIDGVARNPMTVRLPNARPIAAGGRTAFLATARPLEASLGALRNISVASID